MTTNHGFPKRSLEELGRQVRRLRQESQSETPRGSTRRRLAEQAERLVEQFEELVTRWVHDRRVAADWRRFLREGQPPPDGPSFSVAPLFRGKTTEGTLVEIFPADDGGYDVTMDGAIIRHESVPWHLEPDTDGVIQIDGHWCTEIFQAPDRAVQALDRLTSTTGIEPPWRWGRELVEDGLVTPEFGVTPRGRRCLANRAQPAGQRPESIRHAVLAANGARARIFTLENDGEPELGLWSLVEHGRATHPEQRARQSDVFSDTRPGLRRGGPQGQQHAVSDRRGRHRRVATKRFAEQAVDEASRIWEPRSPDRIILVAAPKMLGLLRAAIARYTRVHPEVQVRELARELTWMGPPALHDALAEAELLPHRGRLPPLRPVGARALEW